MFNLSQQCCAYADVLNPTCVPWTLYLRPMDTLQVFPTLLGLLADPRQRNFFSLKENIGAQKRNYLFREIEKELEI